MHRAHEVETVTMACDAPAAALLSPERKLNKGRIAVASKVANHMAKLVRESLLGKSCTRSQTDTASNVPATAL
jgi:hypothetical protein